MNPMMWLLLLYAGHELNRTSDEDSDGQNYDSDSSYDLDFDLAGGMTWKDWLFCVVVGTSPVLIGWLISKCLM